MPTGGQWMTPAAGGAAEWVPDSLLGQAVKSGFYAPLPGDTQVAIKSGGLEAQVPLSELAAHEQQSGAVGQTGQEFRRSERGVRLEREHGDLGGRVATGAEQFVDSAFLGLPGLLARGIAPGYAEQMRERAETNPATSGVSGVVGVVAPALASGGASLLAKGAAMTGAGLLARGSAAIAARGAERGLIAKLALAGAGATLEGTGLGFGEGVHEVAMSDDPVTVERLASVVSSRMAIGGLTGGAAGITAKAAETAIGRFGAAIKGPTKTAANAVLDDGAHAAQAAQADDLAGKSLPELQAAEKAEKEAMAAGVETTRAAQKAAAAAEGKAYREAVVAKNPNLVINEGDDARQLVKANAKIKEALYDPKGLAQRPEKVLEALRRQEGAFERAIANTDEIAGKLASVEKKHARQLGDILAESGAAEEVSLKGKMVERYGTWKDKRIPRQMQVDGYPLPRAEAEAFHQAMLSGEIATARSTALKELPALLEHNRAWQKSIEAAHAVADASAVSPRMQAILDAKELVKAGASAPKSLGQRLLHAGVYSLGTGAAAAMGGGMASPVVGGYLAEKAGALVFKRLGAATAEQAARTARAVDAFVNVSSKATRAAPVLATKTLLALSYAPPKEASRPGAAATMPAPAKYKTEGKEPPLHKEFKRVAGEIRSQMDGVQVSRAARRNIARNLAGVSAASVKVADSIETLAVRRLEFLASKLPQRPDIAAMQIGPDRWGTSTMQIRAFARYAAAVEDPGGVEERVAAGTVTPEDAEAYRTVYPERYADFQRQIIEKVSTLRASLPYRRRLALSIFSGVAVDPAMHPMILPLLQANYADEPNTDGGTAAPTAQPQYGSVSKEAFTPGQTRAGGQG